MPHRSLAASHAVLPLAVAFLASSLSCFNEGKAPTIVPTRALLLAPEDGPGRRQGPVSVVFREPQGGEGADGGRIGVMFDRPMQGTSGAPPRLGIRAVSPAPGSAAAPVAGGWRWVGETTAVFGPAEPLAPATEYEVEVPAGLAAADGSALPAPFSYRFTTERPRLVAATPHEGTVAQAVTFELRYNQAIDPAEIQRAAHLLVGDDRRAWPIRVAAPSPAAQTRVVVTPEGLLPPNARVELSFDASVHGLAGPLPSAKAERFEMRTMGPLAVVSAARVRGRGFGRCAGSSLEIELSNPVTIQELEQHTRLVPAAPLAWKREGGDALTKVVVRAAMDPGKRYDLEVTAGLKDVYGQALSKTASRPLGIGEDPFLDIAAREVFAADDPAGRVPVQSANLAAYDLLVQPLNDVSLGRYLGEASPLSGDPLADARKAFPKAAVEVIRPGRPFGVAEEHAVALEPLFRQDRGRGAALVVAETEGPTRVGPAIGVARLVTRTDLALTARVGLRGAVAWVTHLSDGSAAKGATVTLRDASGAELASARADDDGMVTIPASAYVPTGETGNVDPRMLLLARAGDDWTFRALDDALDNPCQLPSFREEGLVGVLFTDRDEVALGDTVNVKGVFRDESRQAASAAGRPVRLAVRNSRGAVVTTVEDKLDSYGGFAASVKLPATERSGPWALVAEVASVDERPSGSAEARIVVSGGGGEEGGPVMVWDRPSFVRGDALRLHARPAEGAIPPAAGSSLRYRVLAARERYVPPGLPGVVVGDEAGGEEGETGEAVVLADGVATTAADGSVSVDIANPPATSETELVTVEIGPPDAAVRGAVRVHPAEHYVAILPPKTRFFSRGGSFSPAALAVDPEGRKLPQVPLHFELVQRASAGGKGAERVIAACDAATGQGPASCALPLPEVGPLVLRVTSKDARRNTARSSTEVFVLPEANKATPPSAAGAARVRVVADKERYEAGEAATLLVASPFAEADALVVVEGGEAPKGERFHVSGGLATVRVPITADMIPAAHVSAMLVPRGRAGALRYASGGVDVAVEAAARRLRVGVVPTSAKPSPGDFLDADVIVTDLAGAPVRASVTVAAVEGPAPDTSGMFRAFEAPARVSSYWVESRGDEGGAPAGEGYAPRALKTSGPRAGERARLAKTAFFDGTLLTDAVGRAHVRFRFPESAEGVSLTAVAVGQGSRFGVGEATVAAAAGLAVEADAPAVVRAGDAFEARARIKGSGLEGPVKVSVAGVGLSLGAETEKVVTVPAAGHVDVAWPIRAPEAGPVELVFTVRRGDTWADARLSRTVVPPVELESVVLGGKVKDEAVAGLGPWEKLRTDEGDLELRISAMPLLGLDEGLAEVLRYPYLDTEQHASRLQALLGLPDLVKDYKVPMPAEVGALVDAEVRAILEAQLEDGSFAVWAGAGKGGGPSAGREDAEAPWRSAYALSALNLANLRDHHVPDDAVAKAVGYVKRTLAGSDQTPRARAVAAFALDVLSDMGFVDAPRIEELYQAKQNLPLFARALLAHAMTTSQMDPGSVEDLLSDVENHLRSAPDGATVVDDPAVEYAPLFDTNTRTTAMVLRAIVARAKARAPNVFKKIKPTELVTRIARGLLSLRRGGAWRTPEETIWALRALEDYRAAHERNRPDVDAFFYWNGALLLKVPMHDRTTWQNASSFAMRKVIGAHGSGGVLGVRVKGDEELYYEARLRYAATGVAPARVDRGLAVEKSCRALPAGAGLRVGDRVVCDVLVASPLARGRVVLDDPLPGGFEATARGAEVSVAGGGGESRVEAREDRVLATIDHLPPGITHLRYVASAKHAGRFVVPPTRAVDVYDTDGAGSTDPGVVEIAP